MDELLFYKKGLHPRYWTLETTANTSVKYEIGVRLPDYIKIIIGIMCYGGGINTSNGTVPSMAEQSSLFLGLRKSTGFIFDELRLNILSSMYGTFRSGDRFVPCNIKNTEIDLMNSYILNPAALNRTVMLGFLYLGADSFKNKTV